MSKQMQDLRAVIWPLLNPDTGLFHCDTVPWAGLEGEPGRYNFAPVRAAIERAAKIKRYALLRVEPSAPAWCAAPVEDFVRLLEALGEAFGGECVLWGVDVVCPGPESAGDGQAAARVAQAFAAAFPHAFLFAEAGSAFEGLLQGSGRLGVIVSRETLPRYGGAWGRTPLRMRVAPDDAYAVQAAIEGHVSVLETCEGRGANAASHVGHRFEVRTVCVDTAPDGVEATVTVANAGTLPCYTDAAFRIRLCGSDVADARAFPLPGNARDIKPGGVVTLSRKLDVSGLQRGEYDVQVGLFCAGTEYPISCGIEGRISDGYYEGRIILSL